MVCSRSVKRYLIVATLFFLYTVGYMQQFFNNRYVRLAGLTIGLAVLFFVIIRLVANSIGLQDFPVSLELVLAAFGAGLIVYRFFSRYIA